MLQRYTHACTGRAKWIQWVKEKRQKTRRWEGRVVGRIGENLEGRKWGEEDLIKTHYICMKFLIKNETFTSNSTS